MSRARTLAGAIGSDGALNVADVAGLAAVASSGSASDLSTGTLPIARIADGAVVNAKLGSDLDASKLTAGTLPAGRIGNASVTYNMLASGAVTGNLGYTPVNKAGDSYSGIHNIAPYLAPGDADFGRGLLIGNSLFKTFVVNLPDGVANKGVRIYFPYNNCWIDGEFWLTADYSNGNRSGIAHYAFTRHNIGGGSDYGSSATQQYSYGSVMSNIFVQGWGYDSTYKHYIEFRRTDTVGNPLWITMRTVGTGYEYFAPAYPVMITY